MNWIEKLMNLHNVAQSATLKQLRQFGWMVGIVLIAIGFWQLYRQIHSTARIVLWALGGCLLVSGLFLPKVLSPIYKLWMSLAGILGWINTRILLGLIFYLLFTPIGLIMRVLQRDVLKRKIDPNVDTYWVDREKISNIKEHFKRQF